MKFVVAFPLLVQLSSAQIASLQGLSMTIPSVVGKFRNDVSGSVFDTLTKDTFLELVDKFKTNNLTSTWNHLQNDVTDLSEVKVRPIDFSLQGGSRSLSAADFVCASYSSTFNPTEFCSGVVDYDYIIPDGYTTETLEVISRGFAESLGIPFLNTACLTDIKRYICANVYTKCATNGKF